MEEVINKILSMNLAEPYVWKLHLSSCEYNMLEQYLQEHDDELSGELSQDIAILAITYIAEWYRRNYNGHDQASDCVVTCEPKKLWEASGIDSSKFLYKTDLGQSLYKYSIYVLGGLAVKHEIKKKNSDKFLKALCRMYHGEEYTLENLDSESRAIAFRQSIKQKHSLYEFLRDILNDTTGISDEQNQQLISRIKHANEEVLRSKFSLEWLVINSAFTDTMTRRLRIWFKPEEVGGGQHQYLRFDRMHAWGIPNPESMKELFFGIRWWNAGTIVCDLDKNHPLLTFSNNSADGFVSWGYDKSVRCDNIPTAHLTHLEIIAFDKDGNEWLAQREEITTWMQLWRVEQFGDEWSSKQNRQHQTAVVYTDDWMADQLPDMQKCFKSKTYGESDSWNWNYIGSAITITDGRNATNTLYNRSGYDQIYIRLYSNTIRYYEGGMVKYVTEDDEEGEIEDFLPLIFNVSDIRARHFETKDAIIDNNVASDESCESVEYKSANGQYDTWTDNNYPSYGIVQLRVSYRGTTYSLRALYLKGPYHRDCSNSRVKYYDISGNECVFQDTITLDKKPLATTVPLRIGNAIVEVYRPTTIKEIYLDDKVCAYVNQGDKFIVVEILKDRVSIADFSENGYSLYHCKHLPSLFSLCEKGSKSRALEYFQTYAEWPASDFDVFAPKWLSVAFTKNPNRSKSELALLRWNIYEDKDPIPFQYTDDFKVSKGDVIFQNIDKLDDDLSYIDPMIGRPNVFNRIHALELHCFEIACKYHLYFSAVHPLRTMADKNMTKGVLIKNLLTLRNGTLTEIDVSNIKRFANEFDLDINEILSVE
jgi:hypothetical protein